MDKNKEDIVKKTKVKMWAGLVFIVAAGLAIAIYFIFLKDTTDIEKVTSWKTYTNEVMGYQFQYPDNMEIVIDEPKREVDLKGPALSSGLRWPRFYIANYPGEEYRPTDEIKLKPWITEKLGFEEFAEDREIAGTTAVHVDTITNTHDDYIDRYYLLKKGQIFQIDILHVDGQKDWDIYNKFLDSFTFEITDESSVPNSNFSGVNTSDWDTYSDAVNSYSIKVPSDYEVALEQDNYVAFDSSLAESTDLSYMHFVVETRDTDLYTFQISILTNEQVSSDFEPVIEDVTIDSLSGKKITLKNELGETIIHNLVNYLGKTYDIYAGDSIADLLAAVVDNFSIDQFGDDVDITDTSLFQGKECVSHSDCGAYPCNPANGKCLIKDCLEDSECPAGVCGLHVTPVPYFCTTVDVL